jgi:GTPase SAR1 family protein
MKWQPLIATLFIALLCMLLFYQQLARIITVLGYLLVAGFAIMFLVGGTLVAWLFIERLRLVRARRIEAEKQAHVMTITAGNQVFVRDTNSTAIYRALHLQQTVYDNGQYAPPSEHESQAWYLFNTHRPVPRGIQSLPPSVQTGPIDLLPALDNVQRCLIVGPSNSGKTTLLQWIIYRRLHTSKVIVIDPHAWPGKWQGHVFGTGRNYREVGQVLTALISIMTKRYDDIGQGVVAEGHHPPFTIVIDEWRAIVANVGKTASEAIKSLLTESRKAAFSVFLATHSDRAKPLGLEGEYDLKDGFAIVRLSVVDGRRQVTIDTGNGEQSARLPGKFTAPTVGDSHEVIDITPNPSATESKVLAMAQAGASYREISQTVWGEGKFGQFYNQKIEQILTKYGEK